MARGFLLFFLAIAIFILPISAIEFKNDIAIASELTVSAQYGNGFSYGNASYVQNTQLGTLANNSSVTWEYDPIEGKIYGTVSGLTQGIRVYYYASGWGQLNGNVYIAFGNNITFDTFNTYPQDFTEVDSASWDTIDSSGNGYLRGFSFEISVDNPPSQNDRFVCIIEGVRAANPPSLYDVNFGVRWDVSSITEQPNIYDINISTMSGETDVYWFANNLHFPLTDCDIDMYVEVPTTASFYLVLADRINVENGSTVNYNFGLLEQYHVSDKDTSFSYTDTYYYKYTINGIDLTGYLDYYIDLIDDPPYEQFNVTAYRFEGVPKATYTISCTDPDLISNDGIYSDKNFLVYGLYVVLPTALEDFVAGNITFDDASETIMQQTNQAIENAQNDPVAHQLAIAEGQWELDQLVQYSDQKFLGVYEEVSTELDEQVLQFRNKVIPLSTALSNFGNTFVTALEKADTPGQGSLLNTLYTLKLNELELQAKINAGEKLDSAISDEELEYIQDYYQQESALIEQFDYQKYKDALSFTTWEKMLDVSESSTYKSYFDYIISRSEIAIYITIPVAMILVSIVLGTRIHLPHRNKSASNLETADESYSKYYNEVYKMQQGR